jgi:hypothetical protein
LEELEKNSYSQQKEIEDYERTLKIDLEKTNKSRLEIEKKNII